MERLLSGDGCRTGRLRVEPGVELALREWTPASEPRAVVVVVHGCGDHSGRYGYPASRLTGAGLAVLAPDLRGHGLSPGVRGHVRSWKVHSEDLQAVVLEARRRFPGAATVLFGHSTGCVVVLDHCLDRPGEAGALVLCSPALGVRGISRARWALARLLDRLLPSLPLPTGLDVSALSRDREWVAGTEGDPLYHTRATPRYGMELSRASEAILAGASGLRRPALVLCGSNDRITDPESARLLSEAAPGADIIEYDGAAHELWADLCRERVMDDIVRWLGGGSVSLRGGVADE